MSRAREDFLVQAPNRKSLLSLLGAPWGGKRFPVEFIAEDLDDPAQLERYAEMLRRDRETDAYQSVYRKKNPLVSVCITTADRGEVLAERALTSMRKQTYRNLQVIVAGDHCEDGTEACVRSFSDPRFSFINLPKRGPYPPPGRDRWRVAGTYPANEALKRARGDFITHIDEDDTFADDRIAKLLDAIRKANADLVFHPFWWENEDRSWKTLGDGHFEHGKTGTSMVLYHRWFARIPWNLYAYKLQEPGDWNRFRKFKALGARLHYVPELLTWHWMYPVRGPFQTKPGEEFLPPGEPRTS